MQAAKKRLHVSDQVTSKIKEEGQPRKSGHGGREDDQGKASGSAVQPPIQRPDDEPEVSPQSAGPTPPEADVPDPTPSPIVTPIQRPDDEQ